MNEKPHVQILADKETKAVLIRIPEDAMHLRLASNAEATQVAADILEAARRVWGEQP